MPKHLRAASIAAASLAAIAVAAPAANAAQAQDLYVASANSGSLTRTHTSGVYRLMMAQPGSSVTTFTDHPARSASSLSTRKFVRDWAAAGFRADPPNAALVVDDEPSTADVYTFELSRPRMDKNGRLVFRAKRIGPPTSGALEQFAKRADRPQTGRFHRSSLFVDAGSQQLPVEVKVSGLAAGQVIRLGFDQPIDIQPSALVTPSVQVSGAAGLDVDTTGLIIVGTQGTLANGIYDIGVDGTSLSGTATIPAGASVTVSVNHGPAQPISSGAFKVG